MTIELPKWRDLARRLDELGVDLSDYSDDFAWGFVAGADHVEAENTRSLRRETIGEDS